MHIISQKLKTIKPSPTLAVTQKANELRTQGKKIISLSVGEPDFDTPSNIKLAAIEAINKGYTKYTNVDGITPLKQAIIEKFKTENSIEYELSEIIVSSGGKQVLYNLFMASLNEGDEVIIPAPFWVSYPDMVLLAGGKPVIIDCPIENGFKLTSLQLACAITQKTKWFIINSPSNPTGAAYTKAELSALSEVLKQNPHVNILTDDIYEHILFEEFRFFNIINACPELKKRSFIVNGVSKAYSMTGWRIGYGAGDRELVKAMNLIQSQSTSNPCSISQYAALEALTGPQAFIKPNALEFEKKRDLVVKIFNEIEGIECHKPEGAFYIFPSCSRLIGRLDPHGNPIGNSNDFANFLLEFAEVAVVPGIAFGMDGYFRVSTATSIEILTQASNRIKKACTMLKRNL